MNRLLIVDDEKFTVDGLYEMIEDALDSELDLYRAYSPEEALERLARTKIDIVLSDVKMPGMSGLELQKRILAQWPRCKIIFLTGMHNLETAQHAIRTGSIDYILKTEGDEAILRSIRAAIERLAEESQSRQFMLEAKMRIDRALPLLHRDWLLAALSLSPPRVSDETLRELRIPLRSELPVVPLVCRVDRWPEEDFEDRSLLLYAAQNIASEYLSSLSFFAASLDVHHFVCLLQPAANAEGNADQRRDMLGFVQGTMESIQTTCEKLLKLPVSLICGAQPAKWEQLPGVYEQMKKRLVVGIGSGERMLLVLEQGDAGAQESGLPPLRTLTAELERLLEDGAEEAFAEAIDRYASLPTRYSEYSLVYYLIAGLLLGQLAQGEEASGGTGTIADPDKLMNLSAFRTRDEARRYLLEVSAHIHARRRSAQCERTRQLLDKLHAYIRAHLGDDLSLARLSEIVYLNPAYLSVLYKQQTGKNLSEYIADARLDKAKELLGATLLKIHEIADKVGFETAGYFTRFFKKRLQMTPQEYRARE